MSQHWGCHVSRAASAADLLRCIARSRGWVVGNGLPDEARAGRLLLKDYTSGKLAYCEWPPTTSAAQQDTPPSLLHPDDETPSSSEASLCHGH